MIIELTFEELLDTYNSMNDHAKRLYKNNIINEEQYNSYKTINFRWLQNIKLYCLEDLFKVRDPKEDEYERYRINNDDYPLICIIEYRDDTIPVYSDDYGQSMFVRVGDKELSGGTYNDSPWSDFIYFYDEVKMEEF